MSQAVKRLYTPEEYLALEEKAEYKSEYYKGEIFAMAGGTPNHNRIALNVAGVLNRLFKAKGKSCEAFGSDLRVQVKKHNFYTYPDCSVVCGKLEYAKGRKDTITNPVAIVEVLSDSTKDYDRGTKFTLYRGIPTLRDYVLIDQTTVSIEYFHREEGGKWVLDTYDSLEQTIRLESVDTELSLTEIYERVEFESS